MQRITKLIDTSVQMFQNSLKHRSTENTYDYQTWDHWRVNLIILYGLGGYVGCRCIKLQSHIPQNQTNILCGCVFLCVFRIRFSLICWSVLGRFVYGVAGQCVKSTGTFFWRFRSNVETIETNGSAYTEHSCSSFGVARFGQLCIHLVRQCFIR